MKIHKLFICFCLCFSAHALHSQNYQETSSGIRTTLGAVDVEIQFFTPSVVRVIKFPVGTTSAKQSLSVIGKPEKVSFKT